MFELQRNMRGGVPTVLASEPIDSANVYWGCGDGNPDDAVMKVPVDGGIAAAVAAGQPMPWAVVVDDTSVYWTAEWSSIRKAPVGGGPTTVVATGQDNPEGLAVSGDSAYWTTWGGGSRG